MIFRCQKPNGFRTRLQGRFFFYIIPGIEFGAKMVPLGRPESNKKAKERIIDNLWLLHRKLCFLGFGWSG